MRRKQERIDRRSGHEELSPRTRFFLSQLSWGLPLLAATFTLALWLLSNDSKGNLIAGTLSLPATIVTTGISILMFLYQTTLTDDDRQEVRNRIPPRSLRRTLRLTALITGIILGGGGGIFYWTVIHKADIPITDQVLVFSGQGMRNGGRATIQIPGLPPQRRHLSITPTLTNLTNVGDCVAPAQLDFIPVNDGREQQSIRVRPRNEVRLDLTGVTHQATILVTLYTPDPFCMLNLGVSQAILYN